ncbi:MAG: IS630 family transposase [Saprospiraceae bacterium]|nr:IS630 family transposase [Saprospiraceae bacterium]
MRIPLKIKLKQDEYEELQKIINRQKSEMRMVFRAKIILLLSEGRTEQGAAKELDVNIKTIRKWGIRFLAAGIEGLCDSPRSGAPSKFNANQRCEIIAIACDSPKNYGYETQTIWTYDMLTEVVNTEITDLNMSRTSVFLTLSENDLKPNKFKMWLHSKDPEFESKVNEVVDLYLKPPEDAVVISVDEKTGMQATERKYETKMATPGKAGKYEYEYIRHGTQSLIAGFNIATGRVTAECLPTRKAEDLIEFMEKLALEYKEERNIHIIWDNLNIHKDGADNRWKEFNKKHNDKFHFHFTPIHASWVNQVEIFFSILQKKCLRYANFKSVDELKEAVMKYIIKWNEKEGHPFKWIFKGYPLQNV